MSYNGSGTWAANSAGQPVVSGTTITTTAFNLFTGDVATGLSTAICKDGQTTTTASIPFAQGIGVTTGITTPSTTFALVNTTATTVNFAGAATVAINVGGAGNATTWTATTFAHSGKVSSAGSGNGGSASFAAIHATGPGYGFNVSGQAADSTRWDILGTGLTIQHRAVNDAESAATAYITATRTGGSNAIATLRQVATNGIGELHTNGFDLLGTVGLNNINIGTAFPGRSTTNPTNSINIYNGTAPVGTMTNGVTLYVTAGELRVMDAAGNPNLLSPHDKEGNWIADTTIDRINGSHGKRIVVQMGKMLKALNEKFGWDYVQETELTE